MHMQALTNVNTTQAWFGRSRHVKDGNGGLSKHASKTQTRYYASLAKTMLRTRKSESNNQQAIGPHAELLIMVKRRELK